MSSAKADSIGVDVGGTNLRIGVFSGLSLIDELRFQADFSSICKSNTPTDAWQEILDITANALEKVLQKHPSVRNIGIGFPGFINPQTQIIAESPNLPGLINVNLATDLTQTISKKFNIKQIVVENDANAAAYGEYCLAGKPLGGLIYLGLGTGLGGGLILSGKLHSGQHGYAMEAGHIIVEPQGRPCGCGNKGCVEQYASASGISISYFNATQKKHSAAEIAQLAQAGEMHAIQAYEIAAAALAQALASILKIVDVEQVIIGGGVVGAWHLMQKAFDRRLNDDLIAVLRGKVRVTISQANDQAGMLGAAMLASI